MSDRLIRPAVLADRDWLTPRLRESDLAELAAYDPLMLTPREALAQAILESSIARTLVLGGVPEAVWGVVDRGDGKGQVWMMGAKRVAEDGRWFLAESRRQLEQLESGFAEVYNFVDDRYAAALRWLAWLGFERLGTGVSLWSGLPLSLMVRRVGDDRHRAGRVGRDRHGHGGSRDGLLGAEQAQGAQAGSGPERG